MEPEKKDVSFLVFACFIVLFVIFLFLGPNEKSNGNAIIGSVSLGDSPSVATLIILFVILIVILAFVFFVFKKMKSKKVKVDVPNSNNSLKGNVLVPTKSNISKGSKEDIDEGDIEKLFSSNGEDSKKEEPVKQLSPEKPIKNAQDSNKTLANLQDMKNKIKGMISQNFNKDQVISSLKSQGITMDQIGKAMEEVNTDNLRNYVTQALKQGFTRDQIIRNLSMNGWKQDQISKVI